MQTEGKITIVNLPAKELGLKEIKILERMGIGFFDFPRETFNWNPITAPDIYIHAPFSMEIMDRLVYSRKAEDRGFHPRVYDSLWVLKYPYPPATLADCTLDSLRSIFIFYKMVLTRPPVGGSWKELPPKEWERGLPKGQWLQCRRVSDGIEKCVFECDLGRHSIEVPVSGSLEVVASFILPNLPNATGEWRMREPSGWRLFRYSSE
jgi:hypothetical protein